MNTNAIEDMKRRGWRNEGPYWWFEDSLSMSLSDAIYYYRTAK